jgi:histidinol dehydrogenase
VDKIVGPGNLYVTAAKRLVAFDCAIDMLAGPTEIVVTSERGRAEDIAADLVAQAEHDPEALAIFITTNAELANAVGVETKRLSAKNPVAKVSLSNNGLVILAGSVEEARELTNRIAPEHLTVDELSDLDWVRNAGSVFIGRWSPQPMGDYISGPNHTLPTGGTARVRGGLSVNDFVKLITVQKYDRQALGVLGPQAALLADAEGLDGHAAAIRARLKKRAASRGNTKARGGRAG